jgi:regulator of RNase E activity RraA
MKPVDPEYFDILRRYDTPTVCNVIELFDVRPRHRGFMDGRIRAMFPKMPPIVGYATTATFRSAREASEGDAYTLITKQVETFLQLPEPRIVVFEDLDDPPLGATFGEVMCTVYKAFGCAGLITSGAARDLDQVEAIGFPCFASGVSPSHACCRIIDVHVPVRAGGLEVHPGDVLHADRNGVTNIPGDLVREVALGCAKLVAAEEEVIGYARRAKSPTVRELGEAHKRCRDAFARIPAEVRAELGA